MVNLITSATVVAPFFGALISALFVAPVIALGSTGTDPALPHWNTPVGPRSALVQEFAPPSHTYGAGHRGVDVAGFVGQPVVAPLSGRVSHVGSVAGVPVVSVAHGDGTRTTLQPVTATVERGSLVNAGDAVGLLLGVGSHCAPHACLHWGLRTDDAYLDPLLTMNMPRLRLWP